MEKSPLNLFSGKIFTPENTNHQDILRAILEAEREKKRRAQTPDEGGDTFRTLPRRGNKPDLSNLPPFEELPTNPADGSPQESTPKNQIPQVPNEEEPFNPENTPDESGLQELPPEGDLPQVPRNENPDDAGDRPPEELRPRRNNEGERTLVPQETGNLLVLKVESDGTISDFSTAQYAEAEGNTDIAAIKTDKNLGTGGFDLPTEEQVANQANLFEDGNITIDNPFPSGLTLQDVEAEIINSDEIPVDLESLPPAEAQFVANLKAAAENGDFILTRNGQPSLGPGASGGIQREGNTIAGITSFMTLNNQGGLPPLMAAVSLLKKEHLETTKNLLASLNSETEQSSDSNDDNTGDGFMVLKTDGDFQVDRENLIGMSVGQFNVVRQNPNLSPISSTGRYLAQGTAGKINGTNKFVTAKHVVSDSEVNPLGELSSIMPQSNRWMA